MSIFSFIPPQKFYTPKQISGYAAIGVGVRVPAAACVCICMGRPPMPTHHHYATGEYSAIVSATQY